MKNTRKLQFAAELIEEVQEDTDDSKIEVECEAMRGTISELRHRCLQERIQREVDEGNIEVPEQVE